MDGIQPFAGSAAPGMHSRPSGPPHLHHHHLSTHIHKTPGDYARALRRRFWLVILIGLAVGGAGAVWVMRLPAVYRTSAQILIEPPQFDTLLTSIVSQEIGRADPMTMEKYIPNHLALLRSRGLAERVVSDSRLAQADAAGDSAGELLTKLTTRQVPSTGFFDVLLEGHDPARICKLLNTLLETFKSEAASENSLMLDVARNHAERSLQDLQKDLVAIDGNISKILRGSRHFAPGGKNLLEDHYVQMNSILIQKKMRLEDLQHQSRIAELWPQAKGGTSATPRDQMLAELLKRKKYYVDQAQQMRRVAKRFDSDPAAQFITGKLKAIMDEIEQLQADQPPPMPDLSEMNLQSAREEIDKLEQEVRSIMQNLQETMPEFQSYLTMLKSRDQLVTRIESLRVKLANFEVLAEANRNKNPINIVLPASEPTNPVRPNRGMLIAIIACAGLALGGGFVWLLEHLDHSVKMPEHLSMGLTLPLFGVIPRIARRAELDRGGHLWTPSTPASLEADAFRNLRASLLGASGPRGPIVTLLVTSAKEGEGKSTTALNLAATCARAGERTILVDVDLRRPSLAGVFDDGGHGLGLVDILRGDMPWQRAVVRTDISGLDFLPTGDTFDIPVEILGTLELRQLMISLSRHYDRVILDGPAVLGMADCRMLGRIVDAALLVVRCGAHDLRPLRRAKAMLEQSQVQIAGVVFNGLKEDLQNWSSYGSSYSSSGEGNSRDGSAARGLPSPVG